MQHKSVKELEWKDRFCYKKTVPFDLGIAKFQLIRFPNYAEIKSHYHKKTIEVFYTTRGSGTLYINKVPYHLNKENIYLIEPRDAHAIRAHNNLEMAIFKPIEGGEDDIYWNES